MEESEKLTALKKAYADIILNTAKEAAARIMVSERKAIRFQQELSDTKGEAFRILLRLKQMLDSKVSESEMESLNQRKKIEELEAQLEEAEDIVRELRAELQEVQDELENVKKTKSQPLDNQTLAGNDAKREDLRKSHEQDAAYNRSSFLNETCLDRRHESKNDFQMDDDQVHSQDFASMVMGSKEPELYRNGCTQRVRAFERKSCDGKVYLTGRAEGGKSRVLNIGSREGELMCKAEVLKADSIRGEKKNKNELKALPKLFSEDIQIPLIKSVRKKRKRATRYKRKALPSLVDVMSRSKSPDLHCSESLSVDNEDSENCPSEINVTDDQNGLVLISTPELPETKQMPAPSGCPEVSGGGAPKLNDCRFGNATDHDKAVICKSDFAAQESLAVENLEASAYKIDVDPIKESSVNLDMKNCDVLDDAPIQHLNNKVLKYTFQRKRKKEALSSPDGKSSLDESIPKKRMKDKQSVSVESDKCTLATESSRDNRRLAQVARQLISLSEKKWH